MDSNKNNFNEQLILQYLKSIDGKQDEQNNKLDGIVKTVIENTVRSKNNETDVKKIFNRAWAIFILALGGIFSGLVAIVVSLF